VEILFIVITDVTGISPWRINGNTSVGCSGQAAFMREQRDMIAENWSIGTSRGSHC
jgi:hypothetical protein